MIYFYYGQDKTAIHKKASKIFLSLKTKKPDASFVSLDGENVSPSAISELYQSQGLFEQKVVAYFRNIISESELEDEISKKISDLAKSQNIFIWTEYKVSKETLVLFKKNSEKIDIIETKEKKKTYEEFNMFSLAEAFGKRDKKSLWMLFQKARMKASAEEIHGILFWQLKSILVAEASKTAEEADMKPYTFSKSKGYVRNYSVEELQKISEIFIEMYHDAHRGKGDFMLALEKFILSI